MIIGQKIFNSLRGRRLLNWMTDSWYLKLVYKYTFGKPLNLKNPHTFNEKLQWLKIHDHNPLYTTMVDKYEVKKYVASIIGNQYIIPTIGVWDSFNEIDFDSLPEQFVLKCTHDSGGLVICKDKSKLDMKAARARIEKSMHNNFYYWGREWPYKNVRPRIIAEKYIEDHISAELTDYKLMIFNGELKCSFVCTRRYTGEGLRVTFYDSDWNVMPFERYYPKEQKPMPKPTSYKKMIKLAEKLSEGIPFVRIDFYEILGQPYFGEITFFPGNGMEKFSPEDYDLTLGEWIKLPRG